MAFEAYLQQGTTAPSHGRRITFTVSIVAHAAAVLAAVAYSFWHVEELTPPRVQVTFVSAAAAPPPPPPPPPLGGGPAAPKHKTVSRPAKVEAIPKTSEVVVQPKPIPTAVFEPPKETPAAVTTPASKEQPAATGTNGAESARKPAGVAGGVANGIKGGVSGGTGTAAVPPATKMLPPQMGAQQKLSGADPDFPAYLRQSGVNYVVMAKITVGISGAVDSVVLLKHAHPTLDNNVLATVKTWKFKPLMANGTPVPFSYFGRFEFKSE